MSPGRVDGGMPARPGLDDAEHQALNHIEQVQAGVLAR